jgi:hypothetical protein
MNRSEFQFVGIKLSTSFIPTFPLPKSFPETHEVRPQGEARKAEYPEKSA